MSKKHTFELYNRAVALRARGFDFPEIARELKISTGAVRRWLDPEFVDDTRVDRKAISFKELGFMANYRQVKADAERLMRMIPEDTRTEGERLLGDPLPGRSALDRMRGLGIILLMIVASSTASFAGGCAPYTEDGQRNFSRYAVCR